MIGKPSQAKQVNGDVIFAAFCKEYATRGSHVSVAGIVDSVASQFPNVNRSLLVEHCQYARTVCQMIANGKVRDSQFQSNGCTHL